MKSQRQHCHSSGPLALTSSAAYSQIKRLLTDTFSVQQGAGIRVQSILETAMALTMQPKEHAVFADTQHFFQKQRYSVPLNCMSLSCS